MNFIVSGSHTAEQITLTAAIWKLNIILTFQINHMFNPNFNKMDADLTDLLINAIVAVVSFIVGFLNRKKKK
jgi:hypothetical protein